MHLSERDRTFNKNFLLIFCGFTIEYFGIYYHFKEKYMYIYIYSGASQ